MTSREIDALVAEKVMGWKPCDRVAMGWGTGPRVWLTGDEREEGNPTFQGFEPSEKAEHSKLVRDRMRELGWNLDMFVADMASAQFWGFVRAEKAVALDLEMAVALACLKAFGVGV